MVLGEKKRGEKSYMTEQASASNRLAEVAGLFLRLGFTAFGGPAAYIAMMRQEIVQLCRWISDKRFLDLLGVVNLIHGSNSPNWHLSGLSESWLARFDYCWRLFYRTSDLRLAQLWALYASGYDE